MLPRALGDYGAPYVNRDPIEDPTSEADALLFNRQCADQCQQTRVTSKVILHFPTVASGNSTPVYTDTLWGSGSSFYPTTITRTGVGLYTITYPTSFLDDQGVAEALSFAGGDGTIQSTTVFGSVQFTCAANVISLVTINTAGAAADLTAGTIVRIDVR